MDITNKTFLEKLPEIKKAIDECTFLSIDCEFSGLHSSYRSNAFDTPTEYFQNLHKHIKKFLVLQFGLSIFRYDSEKQCFLHKEYNFYTFPKQLNKNMPDHTFSCQSSTMDFLISHGFDFNKLFQEGISYLNSEDEVKYKEKMENSKSRLETSIINTSDENVRRNKTSELIKIDKNIKEIYQAVGFSSLMTYISESQKLVVGHNMLLDVFHTIDKFMTPLSDDYLSFKECVTCLFPLLLDTKHISNEPPFKLLVNSTVLTNLLPILSNDPFSLPKIELDKGCEGHSIENPKDHNAGYDAYITGVCLISMWKYLGEENDINPNVVYENFNLLEPFFNRLALGRLQDINFIRLDGPDWEPLRNHVFYLNFSKTWGLNDIMQLFSPFGNVFVAWLNETSAFVSLHRRNLACKALSVLLKKGIASGFTIMTYNAFKSRQQLLSVSSPQIINNSQVPKTETPKTDAGKIHFKRKNSEEVIPSPIIPRKRTLSKTFQEDSQWD